MPARPGPLPGWLWLPMLGPESRRWVSSGISGLRAVPEGQLPRARCKVQHGFRFPMASWQSMSRGNVPSDGGVERYVCVWRRANRGRSSLGSDGAVNYTDQTLNRVIPKTHPQLREASGWGVLCWGADTPPAQAATLACRAGGRPRWGDAPQGPRRCSVELAQSFASPSPCVADGTLFFQTLLSFSLFLSAQPY